ncbi:MAG: hypothetical protein COB35_06635 [Gammaproteobacteria bacterium]|nr:MAG: hypothetical protein COB35_06635 [Gammaproteobacteria bacterium]
MLHLSVDKIEFLRLSPLGGELLAFVKTTALHLSLSLVAIISTLQTPKKFSERYEFESNESQ